MAIITHNINLPTKDAIKNVSILSYTPEYLIYNIKYENSTIQNYIHKYNLLSNLEKFVFFEYINNYPLWIFEYKINYNDNVISFCNARMLITIKLDIDLINNYLNKSMALTHLMYTKCETLPIFTKFNSKISFIPENAPHNKNVLSTIQLYDYQLKSLAKMITMEKKLIEYKVSYMCKLDFENHHFKFDPIKNIITDSEKYFNIEINGGILADEMGLGKTITTLALIVANPSTFNEIYKFSKRDTYDKIYSKATIIICPSHLTKQWELEAKKVNPLFKIKTIVTKKDHQKTIFKDFVDADIIITSHQFLMNFKYYPTLYYEYITPSFYNSQRRSTKLKQVFLEKIKSDNILDHELPIFEFFYFNRLILDEGHEIFGEMLGNQSLSKYMTSWLSSIDADNYWYVSGSPFVNYQGLFNSLKFLGLKLIEVENNFEIDVNNVKDNVIFNNFLSKEYFWNKVLEHICIRHKKTDLVNQLIIQGYEEIVEWIEFTSLEKNIYESKVNKYDTESLLKLCCHPLVLESSKKIFGNIDIDLSVMESKLIEHHQNIVKTYEKKLSLLTNTNPSYHMVKKNFETMISESKYLLSMLQKLSDTTVIDEENTCTICLESNNLSITKCGHIYCVECIERWLKTKANCPICKKNLIFNEIYKLKKTDINVDDNVNPLIKKYGSKLGKIISIIRNIILEDNARIIIFSQWDTMLSLISKSLSENGIANCSVKGNVWSRNSAISKFKNGKTLSGEENKIILLSLKNCASGTNLTEATHIFFVEPINDTIEVVKAIENQAIARACRIGQKQKIKLFRILIKDSIEENIYNSLYK